MRPTKSCTKGDGEGKHDVCIGPHNMEVHSPWMKVKAALYLMENVMNEDDRLLFMDSDAFIAVKKDPARINMTLEDAFPIITANFHLGRPLALIYSSKTYWR
eukprot:UN23355